jgi:hypothetical protein
MVAWKMILSWMKRQRLFERAIGNVDARPIPTLSSAGLDFSRINVLAYDFAWDELVHGTALRLRGYLGVLYRMATVELFSESGPACWF